MVSSPYLLHRRKAFRGTDPFFSDVALLLHFDGSNGSTTFTDSSSNGYTLTANGNAQITTTDPKFGSGAGLFDGTGDYLNFTGPSGMTGDFTIEAWINPSNISVSGGGERLIFSIISGSSVNVGFSVLDLGGLRLLVRNDAATNNIDLMTATGLLTTGTWYYVAAKVSGTTASIWIDGTQRASGTLTGTRSQGFTAWRVGRLVDAVTREFNGKIDELRVTRGVARDVSVVPTAAFPNS